ncbi:mucin-16-like [Protopterus annectens]|uniref:mucin-16-like n=1 Tax=Protopterus annectens TaxID=7888 RepID=UPI001CFBFF85|nr:mucin-16-like [Protopterus annectens]
MECKTYLAKSKLWKMYIICLCILLSEVVKSAENHKTHKHQSKSLNEDDEELLDILENYKKREHEPERSRYNSEELLDILENYEKDEQEAESSRYSSEELLDILENYEKDEQEAESSRYSSEELLDILENYEKDEQEAESSRYSSDEQPEIIEIRKIYLRPHNRHRHHYYGKKRPLKKKTTTLPPSNVTTSSDKKTTTSLLISTYPTSKTDRTTETTTSSLGTLHLTSTEYPTILHVIVMDNITVTPTSTAISQKTFHVTSAVSEITAKSTTEMQTSSTTTVPLSTTAKVRTINSTLSALTLNTTVVKSMAVHSSATSSASLIKTSTIKTTKLISEPTKPRTSASVPFIISMPTTSFINFELFTTSSKPTTTSVGKPTLVGTSVVEIIEAASLKPAEQVPLNVVTLSEDRQSNLSQTSTTVVPTTTVQASETRASSIPIKTAVLSTATTTTTTTTTLNAMNNKPSVSSSTIVSKISVVPTTTTTNELQSSVQAAAVPMPSTQMTTSLPSTLTAELKLSALPLSSQTLVSFTAPGASASTRLSTSALISTETHGVTKTTQEWLSTTKVKSIWPTVMYSTAEVTKFRAEKSTVPSTLEVKNTTDILVTENIQQHTLVPVNQGPSLNVTSLAVQQQTSATRGFATKVSTTLFQGINNVSVSTPSISTVVSTATANEWLTKVSLLPNISAAETSAAETSTAPLSRTTRFQQSSAQETTSLKMSTQTITKVPTTIATESKLSTSTLSTETTALSFSSPTAATRTVLPTSSLGNTDVSALIKAELTNGTAATITEQATSPTRSTAETTLNVTKTITPHAISSIDTKNASLILVPETMIPLTSSLGTTPVTSRAETGSTLRPEITAQSSNSAPLGILISEASTPVSTQGRITITEISVVSSTPKGISTVKLQGTQETTSTESLLPNERTSGQATIVQLAITNTSSPSSFQTTLISTPHSRETTTVATSINIFPPISSLQTEKITHLASEQTAKPSNTSEVVTSVNMLITEQIQAETLNPVQQGPFFKVTSLPVHQQTSSTLGFTTTMPASTSQRTNIVTSALTSKSVSSTAMNNEANIRLPTISEAAVMTTSTQEKTIPYTTSLGVTQKITTENLPTASTNIYNTSVFISHAETKNPKSTAFAETNEENIVAHTLIPIYQNPFEAATTTAQTSSSPSSTAMDVVTNSSTAFVWSVWSTVKLVSAAPQTAATAQLFTLNFTLNNLPFITDLNNPLSSVYNSTVTNLTQMLNDLLKASYIKDSFTVCQIQALRQASEIHGTTVDMLCANNNDSSSPGFDIVNVYRNISDATKNTTALGPYTLQPGSLYVNGYNESPAVTAAPTTSQPAVTAQLFTVNVTFTTLLFTTDLNNPLSSVYNATVTNLTQMINDLLKASDIKNSFIGCQIEALRQASEIHGTTVDMLCANNNDSSSPGFDIVNVYRNISDATKNTTALGPYTLQPGSLYVNGYNENPAVTAAPTTSQPAVTAQLFTVNVTFTTLLFTTDLNNPLSSVYNATVTNLTQMINDLLKASDIKNSFIGCQIEALRQASEISGTTVDMLCANNNDSSSPGFDIVNVYHNISDATKNTTALGPYTLQPGSLYVNGYNENPAVTAAPTTSQPAVTAQLFTVNVTFTTLLFTTDLNNPLSSVYNATVTNLTQMINDLLKASDIKNSFIGCQIEALRQASEINGTTVDMLCANNNDSSSPGFDIVNVYRNISDATKNTTALGPYTLQPGSLYVNGYNENPAVTAAPTTSQPAVTAQLFTVNVTFTTLLFTTDLNNPLSSVYNSTVANLTQMINDLLKASDIKNSFIGCQIEALRQASEIHGTTVDMLCANNNDSSSPGFDIVNVYHNISDATKNTTALGPYTLQPGSLYVNGYNENPAVTAAPTTSQPAVTAQLFTVNVTFTTLLFTTDLNNPLSSVYNATVTNLTQMINDLLKASDIKNSFIGCQIEALRQASEISGTTVDMLCANNNDSSSPGFDIVNVYHNISDATKNTTALGPYTLQPGSLYVNGYNENPAVTAAPTTSQPAVMAQLFTVNVTFTTLLFTTDLNNPLSSVYNATVTNLTQMINDLLKASDIKNSFIGCQIEALRQASEISGTTVDMLCANNNDSSSPGFDIVNVYHNISDATKNTTALGPYTLQPGSLYVNGYNENPAVTAAPTTSQPAVTAQLFTVNVTFTTLLFTTDLNNPLSSVYNATVTNLTQMINDLLKASDIKNYFIGCQIEALRQASEISGTTVDMLCANNNDSSSPGFDIVNVYHNISDATKNTTALGPYTLQPGSLYVNGYNENPAVTAAPTTSQPAVTAQLFTVNVTFTTLLFTTDLNNPLSSVYNATVTNLTQMINDLLKASDIKNSFIGCQIEALRQASEMNGTTVDMLCANNNDSSSPGFDIVNLYHNISDATKSTTALGPYTLQPGSLYVNGYNENPAVTAPPTTSQPAVTAQLFTVNVTFTTLLFTTDLNNPLSSVYNATVTNLTQMINDLLKASDIKNSFIGCQIEALRQASEISGTTVDMLCANNNDSSSPGFDIVNVYHNISDATKNTTALGPYTLQPGSLYVNGYNENPAVTAAPTTSQPAVTAQLFTVNVTFTTLLFTTDLNNPLSSVYNATVTNLTQMINDLLKASDIKNSFVGCQIEALRQASEISGTTVDMLCANNNDSSSPGFDIVNVYHNISDATKNTTALGPYTLQPGSLYVNGYNENPTVTAPPTTSQPAVTVKVFTLNVTLTNVLFTADLNNSASSIYNSTVTNLAHLLDDLLKASSINSSFHGCNIQALRQASAESGTTIDAVCTIKNDSSSPGFDKVKVYHNISAATNNVTALGPYILQPDSLFVDGYNEKNTVTAAPTTSQPAVTVQEFTLNVTLTNVAFTADLNNPASSIYNSTVTDLTHMLDDLFKSSPVNNSFGGCHIQTLRQASAVSGTTINAVCTIKNDSTSPAFDRVKVYYVISAAILNMTAVGPYTLQPDSLYVNGYNEKSAVTSAPTTSQPAVTVQEFTLNVTLTNVAFTADLNNPASSIYNSTVTNLTHMLDDLFKSSPVNNSFGGCHIQTLRQASAVSGTTINAVCTIKNDSTSPAFDRVKVYYVISAAILNMTAVGPYTLQPDSLYVNGYNEKSAVTSAPTTMKMIYQTFTVNLTINNLPFQPSLNYPTSSFFLSAVENIVFLLEKTFNSTSIKNSFDGCEIDGFRMESQGTGTVVNAVCKIRNDSISSTFNRVSVYQEFSLNTQNITKMGVYILENDSLYIDGYNERNPPGPYYQNFTVNVTVTNLAFVPEMNDPTSNYYKSATKNIIFMFDNIFKNSSINDTYVDCRIDKFSSSSASSATTVNAVCKIKSSPSSTAFDRVKVYREFSRNSNNLTVMGVYQLQNDSLYINGYNERYPVTPVSVATTAEAPIIAVTNAPVQNTMLQDFRVNFSITNLYYTLAFQDPSSKIYQYDAENIASLVAGALDSTTVRNNCKGCTLISFRPEQGASYTSVSLTCKFQPDNINRVFNETLFYRELKTVTSGFTNLGTYDLLADSLFVNDYRELTATSAAPTTTISVAQNMAYNIDFTITNFNLTSEDPNSEEYKAFQANIRSKLQDLFNSSSLKNGFLYCNVTNLKTGSVVASSTCFFKGSTPGINSSTVHNAFSEGTNGTDSLGGYYQLKSRSLSVRDISTSEAQPVQTPYEFPNWAIILIAVAAFLVLALLFLCCLLIPFCLRRKMSGYNMEQSIYGQYFSHLDFRKLY